MFTGISSFFWKTPHKITLIEGLAIRTSYYGPLGERSFINYIPWSESVKPDTLTFAQIQEAWRAMAPIYSRVFVEFVWGHTNIDKEQKLSFLHGILSDSHNSLNAEDRAAKLLSGELKAKYNPPFVFSDINRIWDERGKTNQSSPASTNGSPTKAK